MNRVRTISTVAGMLLAGLGYAGGAQAQSDAPSGRLICQVGGALGLVVTSQRPMECRFVPRRGPTQRYVGTVRNFGLDLRNVRNSVMIWRVYGPYARAPMGVLAGRYTGATAEASAGAGVAGQLLVSDSGEAKLQPLALQASRGINVALGVTTLELAPGRGGRR